MPEKNIFAAFAEWIGVNAPWLGHLFMSVIGGISAHLREWETKHPDYTMPQHMGAIFRRAFMATTAGFMWYYFAKGYEWHGSPFSYVGASVVGLFAPDLFDLLWDLSKKRLTAIVNSFWDGVSKKIDSVFNKKDDK